MAIIYSKSSKLTKSVPRYASQYGGAANLNLAREMLPTGNGVQNVIIEYPWTLTPANSPARAETPAIYLREFYQIDSSINQQLLPYGINSYFPIPGNVNFTDLINLAQTSLGSGFGATGVENPGLAADIDRLYEGVFDHIAPSGFTYSLPFFTQEVYSLSNAWEKKDILETIVDYQKKGVGKISKLGARVFGKTTAQQVGVVGSEIPDIIRQLNTFSLQTRQPAVGLFDPPHVFKASAPRSYTFSFYLYNIESYGTDEKQVINLIQRNWEFCYLLSYQNAINKRNFFTGLPPVYYEVIIPGVHYCKASYMQSIKISNVGNVRVMRIPIDDGPIVDVNVPDAYFIEITMQDLFMPSKNFHDAVTSIKKRTLLSTDPTFSRVQRNQESLPGT